MSLINIKCPFCRNNIEIEDRFKKVICPTCGESIEIEKIKKIEQEKIDNLNKLEKDLTLENRISIIKQLINDENYKEAHDRIDALLKQNNDNIELLSLLLHIDIITFDFSDVKLRETTEVSDPLYWEVIRNILKNYNKIKDSNIISSEDIKYLNILGDNYKDMLLDLELCSKINDLLNEYLKYIEKGNLNIIKKNKRTYSALTYIYNLLGIHIIENNGIRRDMTIYYKNSNSLKHVYSKLDNFNNLQSIEECLSSHLEDYKKVVDEDTNKLF